MRVLDLQRALARTRAPSEYFENERRAVENLGVPRFLEITLLNRGQRAIDHDEAGFETLGQAGDFIDLAFAKISSRTDVADRHQARFDHAQIDRLREVDRLIEPCGGRTQRVLRRRVRVARARTLPRAEHRLEHNGTSGFRASRRTQPAGIRITPPRFQSNFFHGRRRLFGAFEQLDRMTRHDRRDRVLVNKLRMTVPPQQHAEIIEPRHHALQFDAVHQENRERRFVLADVVEEGVLQIL
jgi:hypothetical protein